MAANLNLRIASRVLVRLGEVTARDFGPLRRRAADLDWRRFLPGDRPLRIDASASHCRLYHTGALAETLTLAITDRVGRLPLRPETTAPADEDQDENLSRVLIRGQDDRFTISVDASGALLHRRGWRVETGRAPLRETLAAGLLALCQHDPARPFFDPMCGSGTIVLEACAAALRVAPGLGRGFAFESWPCLDQDAWTALRAQAQAQVLGAPPAELFGADKEPQAVDITRRNAERAGFASHVRLEVAAFGGGTAPAVPGLLLLNPPYGRRLGRPHEAVRLGRDVGRILATRYAGWRVGVISAHPAFAQSLTAGIRRPPQSRHDLRNGGLRIELLVWQL
jgi:putative N6-adenine-specific DNA methylase